MNDQPEVFPEYVYEKDACEKCGDQEGPSVKLRDFNGSLLCEYDLEKVYETHGCFPKELVTCPVCEAYGPIRKGLVF